MDWLICLMLADSMPVKGHLIRFNSRLKVLCEFPYYYMQWYLIYLSVMIIDTSKMDVIHFVNMFFIILHFLSRYCFF